MYRVDPDAVVIAEVFAKTTRATPKQALENSRTRLKAYDDASGKKRSR
jgi:phage-related protein